MRWTDDHCHLGFTITDDRRGKTELDAEAAIDEIVAAARTAGVERFVNVGTDLAESRAAVATAQRVEGVWATVGVHPHEASGGLDGIETLLAERKVVAVGECGLDYHYEHSPRAAQREVFAAQVALARAHDLTLVIHTREAWDDTFAVLATEGVPERTVLHCFSGGPAEARRCLDAGMYLSFSGIITFRSAGDVRDAAALCPADRLLVETDSPYLAPVPHRGKPNQPAFVAVVGETVAAVRGEAPEAVAEATWANAERAYRFA